MGCAWKKYYCLVFRDLRKFKKHRLKHVPTEITRVMNLNGEKTFRFMRKSSPVSHAIWTLKNKTKQNKKSLSFSKCSLCLSRSDRFNIFVRTRVNNNYRKQIITWRTFHARFRLWIIRLRTRRRQWFRFAICTCSRRTADNEPSSTRTCTNACSYHAHREINSAKRSYKYESVDKRRKINGQRRRKVHSLAILNTACVHVKVH